jgi:hypothetical protein
MVEAFLLYVGDLVFKETVKLVVAKSPDIAKKGLALFANSVRTADQMDGLLPSAALLGLGRCGSNVCLEVARHLEAVIPNVSGPIPETPIRKRIWALLSADDTKKVNPYLFEPVILLADLDQRMAQSDQLAESSSIVPGYSRCRRIDLGAFYKQGCGNIPQVGQFFARTMVAKALPDDFQQELQTPKFSSWEVARSYLLDTVGTVENPTRLMIYVFSTGGGTGSGLSSELGAAQRYLLLKRVANVISGTEQKKPHLESYVSLGVGVFPAQVGKSVDSQQLNTGRSLISFLSRLQRFRSLASRNGEISLLDIPPFDCQILVSNNIMASMEGSAKTDFTDAARAANTYISQHLFNILLAQSLPKDVISAPVGDSSRHQLIQALRDGGLEGGELGSFDPSDLKNSLFGLAVVGYAESKQLSTFDPQALVLQAVAAPTVNTETGSIDGISLSPAPTDEYRDLFNGCAEEALANLGSIVPLFRQAVSVVTVLSVPMAKAGVLKASHVSSLKKAVSLLFPKAGVRRFVVVPESSDSVSVGLFVSGSGYLAAEAMRAIFAYALNCFCSPSKRQGFEDVLNDAIANTDAQHLVALSEYLMAEEDISPTLASFNDSGAFLVKRVEVEAISIEQTGEKQEFGSVLLEKEDFLNAVQFMRDGFAYQGLATPKETSLLRLARRAPAVGQDHA